MGLGEALREAVTGSNGGQPTTEQMQNQLLAANVTADALQESMRRLEDAMEDEGWRRLGWDCEREFTRQGLEEMVKLSRAMYVSHPLIQRSIDVKTYYTWAQGVTYSAVEDKIQELVVEPLINDIGNKAEFFGHQARVLTDVDQMVEGNNFFALYTNVSGYVSIRTIPFEQIVEKITREGDSAITAFYRRVWAEDNFDMTTGVRTTKQREELYPDWRYQPTSRPDSIGGMVVNWDTPIMHQRTGGLKKMKFGVPETYSGMPWARAYKEFLDDWHTLVKSLSRFAWKATTSPKKVKGLKKKLEEEGKGNTDEETEGEEETRRPRRKRIGDAFVGKEADKLESINKTGATVSSDDARPSRLMVAAGSGLPDTILSGDVDIGNFATSKTLDRPTELMMVSRQTMWADLKKDIFKYQADAMVRAGKLPGKKIVDPRTGLELIIPTLDCNVEVSFPPVLEDDPKANVDAIVTAATLNGKADAGVLPPETTAKMLMEALGIDDVEAVLKELPEPEAAQVEEALKGLTEAIRASSGA
jgi:hypothetical protein